MDWILIMKRIAILVCGLVLVVSNTAEARRRNWSNNMTYTQPVATTPTSNAPTATSHVAYKVPVPAAGESAESAASTEVAAAAHSTSATTTTTTSYSTATAQGVANIMAKYST